MSGVAESAAAPITVDAAVLRSPGTDMDVEQIVIDAPAADEVRVKVVGSGLCHSDLHVIEGALPYPMPAVLGHEAAGIVEAIGSDVRGLAIGDHVIGCLTQHCGTCHECVNGKTWICQQHRKAGARAADQPRLTSPDGEVINQMTGVGAFAESMLLHRSGVVAIDPDMPLDRAALIGCAVVTGVGAAINEARIRPGETCVVVGCGGIGLNVIQGAALAGAGRIIAIDLQQSKLELAQRFGATDVVNAGDGDAVEAVKALTGGRGVDHAFEAIGLPATVEQALAMASVGGAAYIIGVLPAGANVSVSGLSFAMTGQRLQGVRMGSSNIAADFPRFVEMYQQGKLMIDELVAERITLDQVNAGYETMRNGEQARSVIVFD